MLETYNYDTWFKNKKLSDNVRETDEEESIDLFDMPPLEGDEEELKEAKRINNFNSKQTISQTSNIISTNKS